MKVEELIRHAREAQKKSYSPYSKFRVGAIVELKDGTLVEGANIENASYPLSICAERVAIFSTIMKGYKKEDIVSLTIVGDSKSTIYPCGSCRQVISEMLDKEVPVYCVRANDEYEVHKVKDLLPFAFSDEDLK